jgi:hypothetical protein
MLLALGLLLLAIVAEFWMIGCLLMTDLKVAPARR